MEKKTLDLLKGLAYEYCNEKRTAYTGGVSMPFNELNKTNFEKLSAFLNWVEATKITPVKGGIR